MSVIEGVKVENNVGITRPVGLGEDDSLLIDNVNDPTSIVLGLNIGKSVINKAGRDPDIDTGSVPEDVWHGSLLYTGFPTGAPEEFVLERSSASDTGSVTITYLPSAASTSYSQATIQLTGTITNTGIVGYRLHTASYNSGNPNTFNVGTITCYHRTTTANIFFVMPIGTSQTNVAAFTVPVGNKGIIKRLYCNMRGSAGGQAEGALWVRSFGASPRLRRPFSITVDDGFEEETWGGLLIPGGTDITIRITSVSANNTIIAAGYDILLIRDSV